MKLKFNAPKNHRVHYRYSGIEIQTIDENDWWYENCTNKWYKWEDIPKERDWISSTQPCKSLRSFRRKLKQLREYLPKGTEVRLIGRFYYTSKRTGKFLYDTDVLAYIK